MKLDDLIKRVRRERALSMAQVATSGRFARQTIFEIEHAMTMNLTVATIMGLSKGLRLKPDLILAAAIESMSATKELAHVQDQPD